jgi:hypothetical protein
VNSGCKREEGGNFDCLLVFNYLTSPLTSVSDVRRLDDFSVFEGLFFELYRTVRASIKNTTTSHLLLLLLCFFLLSLEAGRRQEEEELSPTLSKAQNGTAHSPPRPHCTALHCTALLPDWLNALL